MPLLVLAKEVQMFVRACEHLLSMPSLPPIGDDEAALINYYVQELLNRYGATSRTEPVRWSHVPRVRESSLCGDNCYRARQAREGKSVKQGFGDAN